MAAIKALVKPELLAWARDRAKITAADAAKAAGVDVESIEAWEIGRDAPTISQLRHLAAKYHFPLAVFYLPKPPADFAPLRDFRRLPDADDRSISPNLTYHIRNAYERRELALELHHDLREPVRAFRLKASTGDSPETVGAKVRQFLGVTDDAQKKAARQLKSFDFWRRNLEENDVLAFVVSGPQYSVELKEMRGFAEEQKIERFCDAVSAAALMPRDLMLSFPQVKLAGERKWSDDDLRTMAQAIGVSREAFLLRLVTLRRATWDFYNARRAKFKEEYEEAAAQKAMAEKKPIPIKRSVMLMSWNGRGFTRLVLRSYYDQRITLNDVSSYLGAKVKHIPALERAAFHTAE